MDEEDWLNVDKLQHDVIIMDDRYYYYSKRPAVILGVNILGLGYPDIDDYPMLPSDKTLYTENLLTLPVMHLRGYDKGVEFLRIMQPNRKWSLAPNLVLNVRKGESDVHYNSLFWFHVDSVLSGKSSYYYESGRIDNVISVSSGRFYHNRTLYKGSPPPGGGVQVCTVGSDTYFIRLRVGEETSHSAIMGVVTWIDVDVVRTLLFERGDDLVFVRNTAEWVFPLKVFNESEDKIQFCKRYQDFVNNAYSLLRTNKAYAGLLNKV